MISKLEIRIKSIHPVLILGFCLLITTLVTLLSYRTVHNRQVERLNQLSEVVTNSIQARIVRYENSLLHIRAYFKTDPQISRERFHTYIQHLQTTRSYPGIQGLGFTKRVDDEDLKSYEEQVRKEGFPDFKVWPDYPREVYFSIHFLEPFNWRNKRAFGFDMFTDKARQEAMSKARDTAAAALTSKVTLVQETEEKKQPGFLIYLPLYSGKDIPKTIEERREKLVGFIYAPFRSYDFFNEIFSGELATHQEIKIEVYDGEKNEESLLYTNDPFLKDKSLQTSDFKKSTIIKSFNHSWTILTSFRKSHTLFLENITPWLIGLIGSLFSMLIFWVFHAARSHARAMEVSLTRFNALVANLTEGIIIAYPNGDIQLMNKVAREIYQFSSPDEVITKREDFNKIFTFKTLSGDPIEMDDRPIGRVLKGDKYSNYELEFIHLKTGKKHYLTYGGTPIYNKQGQLVLVVVTVKDITYKMKIEIELREALIARDEFMSISSHELKTPLTSLKLNTQLFKRKIEKNSELSSEDILKFTNTIDHQVFRLTRLVDDMLDVSRLRSGKFTLAKEKVNFCDLVQNALEEMKPQFIEAGYTIPTLINQKEAFGLWDPLRIEQVINNLLTNAIRYGRKGEVSLEVKIINNSVQLAVKDHGTGIPKDKKERIFNRFERSTDIHETTGLGLGLFLSQKIIEAHDGKIWLESELNKGSTFYFTLPLLR